MEDKEGVLVEGIVGDFRFVACDITSMIDRVSVERGLSPLAGCALGRVISGAVMLLRLLTKGYARLLLEVYGGGPLGKVVAEAFPDGSVRGMVANRSLELPLNVLGKFAVGEAVGNEGFIRVRREFLRGGVYESKVALVSGEIGDDIAHYLFASEQRKTGVLVGVLAKPSGIVGAGGVIVEPLPGVKDDSLKLLETNLSGISVSRIISEKGLEKLLQRVFSNVGDIEVTHETTLFFKCRCSRERLKKHLVLLSTEQLDYVTTEKGEIEAVCYFCGKNYRFKREELRKNG